MNKDVSLAEWLEQRIEDAANSFTCEELSLSVRERIAIRQALLDEIELLEKAKKYLDEDKIRNRVIICKKALAKIMVTLHKKDFENNQI